MRTTRILTLASVLAVAACGGNDPLSVTTVSLANGTVGESYSAKLVANGGTDEGYKWTVSEGALPGGVDLASSGDLSGTPSADGNFSFTVRVEDSDGEAATKALTLTIAPSGNTVAIDTASLPNGEVGVAYNQTISASGGAGGYTFTISSGSAPTGLTLATDGTLSGTPTTDGNFSFTVQVADSDGANATKMYSVMIAAATGFRITTLMLPNGATGQAYAANVESADGTGDITWSISEGVLPGGLSIGTDGVTTMITGTPDTAGNFDFTVRAVDGSGAEATRALTIVVTPGEQPLMIETTTVADATVGVAYSATIVARDGSNMGYTWSITTGTLPDGLTIGEMGTPSTMITGTPGTAGSFPVEVTVMDSVGATAAVNMTITVVVPPLSIAPGILPDGDVGVAYDQTLTAVSGSGAGHTWNIVSGALPTGLTLTPNGATANIAGTPTAAGTFTFDIQLTDSAGSTDTVSYTVIVYPQLTIDTATVANGYVGISATATLTASGGNGMGYMFTVSNGTLPPGLTLSAMAPYIISGAPSAAGSFTFTIEVSDSRGTTASRTYRVEIYEQLRVATAMLPTATTAVAYNENIAAIGGAPGALTWTMAGGTLPPGLTLGASTTNSIPLSGVPTMLGTYTFDMTVADSYIGSDTNTITIVVFQPIAIDTPDIPPAAIGVPYTASITASGGSQMGYQWSVVTGALPGGLTLGATGTPSTMITGTTNTAGTFSFTIEVTDSNGGTAQFAYTMDVVPPLQIVTTQIVGRPICTGGADVIATSGGSGTGHTWSVSAGTLPGGWQLDAAGSPATTISGRATAQGQSSFTLNVTDSGGFTASQPYVVDITDDANAQRLAVITGDILVNNETGVFLVDACGDTPGAPLQLNPPGGTTGDASTTADLTGLSPDSTKVFFVGDFATDGNNDLYVVDLTVQPPLTVNLTGYLGTTADVADAFWAPNSNLIAFIADPTLDGRNELFVVDVSDPASPGTPLVISGAAGAAGNDVSANDVFWAPNSTGLVLHADLNTDAINELYYVNLANPGAPVQAALIHAALAGAQDCEDDVYWAPDSSGVLFRCDIVVADQDELWFTALPSAQPAPVRVNSTGYGMDNDVGFDNYRFAPAGALRAHYLADEVNNGSEELFITPFVGGVPGTPVRVLAALPANRTVSYVKWNPQGTRLAFRSDLDIDERFELYVVDVSGALPAVPTRVSSMPALGDLDASPSVGFGVQWSPDGTRIAYVGDQDLDGVDRAYVADVTGVPPYTVNNVVPITTDGNFDASQVYWGPDGNWIAIRGDFFANSVFELAATDVSAAGPYTAQIVNLPLSGGQDVSSGAGAFFFRRDGAGVFFESDMITDNDTEMWMSDLSTGAPAAPVRMHGAVPANGDASVFYVEP